MTNTTNTNTIITADDLRKLVKVFAHHTYDVVQATELEVPHVSLGTYEDDTTIAAFIERTKKHHAESVAMQELFEDCQDVKLDEDTARSIIHDLLMDRVGLSLALCNLVKQISADYDISDEDLADIAEDDPALKNAKLEAI